MAHSTHTEVERKYDVGLDADPPDLVGIGGVAALGSVEDQRLVAEYFDTESLDLARLGISLRRRQGGHDSGWHLKVPASGVGRTEIRFPLGDADDAIPADLATLVRGPARDRPLIPIARLLSHRLERPLLDDAGQPLALLTDDRVMAQRHTPGTAAVRWREWEVELVRGDDRMLDAVEASLLTAGAEPAAARSKIRRALGLDGKGGRAALRDEPAAGEVLTAYVARYRDRLLVSEVGVRLGEPEAIHHMRTATRRLRSVLATHRRLLDDAAGTDHLRSELQWLGQLLGTARDAHVLRSHLVEVLESEPPELVHGPVRARIDDQLGSDFREGLARAVEELGAPRYLSVIAGLDRLVGSPAYTPEAAEPAQAALPRVLAREVKRLRRAEAAVPPPGQSERDERLHDVRKKAKRLRYAADAARPVLGAPATALAKRAKRVQESLGTRQDAVVARVRLRELGVQAHLGGDNGFTFGRMHAIEDRRADEAEVAFQRAWERLPKRHVRRRLAGT
jgi:CHAD domain-containing protein